MSVEDIANLATIEYRKQEGSIKSKLSMKKKHFKEYFFEWDVFKITVKQITLVVWVSLFIAIGGAINYEGEIFTIGNSNKLITGLNAVIFQIFIAYLTGFILYFLFELLAKTKKRIATSSSIGNNVLLIKERVEYLLNEIGKKKKNDGKEFELTADTFRDCCESIKVDIEIVKVWYYPDYTFRQFVLKSCEEIKVAANEILSFSDALSEKWAYTLSMISGLSDKVAKSLDIRFAEVRVEFYHLWGLYAQTDRMMELLKKFDKDHFRIAGLNAPRFHPIGLSFKVNRKK